MKSLAALALAASVVALPAEPKGQTISVPIRYNRNAVRPSASDALATAANKYAGAAGGLWSNGDGSGTVITKPTNSVDRAYITEVEIGTPAQKLFLDFDTGSSDLWVYTNDTKAGIANGVTLYQPGDSSTAQRLSGETWKIYYGDGTSANGVVYSDVVSIGGLAVQNQAVESVISADSFGMSGLLGLAYDVGNTVKPDQQKTWFSNIKDSLKAPVFTVRLRHQADGSFDFGYINSSLYTGDIVYAPAFTDKLGHRLFAVDGYSVGGGSVVQTGFNATADTGTSLLIVSNDVAKDYWSQVSGSSSQDDGNGGLIFFYPCASLQNLPDFTLSVNGNTVTVPGSFNTYQRGTSGSCEGGIVGGGAGGMAILGDVFLKAIFTVFDDGNNQVGFALGQ
ncbi:Peptidase A1 [Cordyceps fumosorosea ARSEF 2679]|uniref:Peptidase A1 n=1 Tax=Cordyceps fumosorosea (strain ARSEF 2679) TaxID=1081104 RepID=A0A167IM08_CORFA|nr:Peptidase A1 [Cordyceps fumosorosea ARSEF 2679]OAA49216.1 Peptidase A1 [Cordyceps fumosorosea ARSEF 2679]